jgi:hypothetical protein
MMRDAKQLGQIRVLVAPKMECEKVGITNFKFGMGEGIAFKGHHEDKNKTEFLVTASAEGGRLLNRAKFLIESFLGLLELGSRGSYSFEIAGLVVTAGTTLRLAVELKPIAKLEDLDFVRKATSSLESFGAHTRDRIVRALYLFHNGLTALIDEQSYLSIYGGLQLLIGDVAKGKGTTTKREDVAIVKFVEQAILEIGKTQEWMTDLDGFHETHYRVLYGGECKKEDLNKIKGFFKKFLAKYIEYSKLIHHIDKC